MHVMGEGTRRGTPATDRSRLFRDMQAATVVQVRSLAVPHYEVTAEELPENQDELKRRDLEEAIPR